jgi:hypothetical protein
VLVQDTMDALSNPPVVELIVGFGTPFAAGTTFFAASSISPRRASSSRRSCRSYKMDERACSIKAAVISSLA